MSKRGRRYDLGLTEEMYQALRKESYEKNKPMSEIITELLEEHYKINTNKRGR